MNSKGEVSEHEEFGTELGVRCILYISKKRRQG